jgi:hypothetical protein
VCVCVRMYVRVWVCVYIDMDEPAAAKRPGKGKEECS